MAIGRQGQHESLSVTWSQVAAFRLARHHLLERALQRTLVAVAGDMAGAQAQLLSAAQTSLWARVQDLQIARIEKALSQRTLVKAACMRQTLFLVPSKDVAIFVRGTARRAEKEIRWALGKGVPERLVEAAIAATLEVLDQPLTRPEIAERVSRRLGVRTRAYHGGGWGSRRELAGVPIGELTYPVVELLHLVAARGVVCYGPYHGNEPTFVRADAWVPHWQDVSQEQAEEMLELLVPRQPRIFLCGVVSRSPRRARSGRASKPALHLSMWKAGPRWSCRRISVSWRKPGSNGRRSVCCHISIPFFWGIKRGTTS